MKKILLLLLLLSIFVVGANSVWADNLNSGNTSATSQAFNPTGSFWNNTSSDTVNGTNAANVGNMLMLPEDLRHPSRSAQRAESTTWRAAARCLSTAGTHRTSSTI